VRRYRRNADEPLRKLERAAASGDPEARERLFVARIRAGDVPQENLRYLATLGDPVASRYARPMRPRRRDWFTTNELALAGLTGLVLSEEAEYRTRAEFDPFCGIHGTEGPEASECSCTVVYDDRFEVQYNDYGGYLFSDRDAWSVVLRRALDLQQPWLKILIAARQLSPSHYEEWFTESPLGMGRREYEDQFRENLRWNEIWPMEEVIERVLVPDRIIDRCSQDPEHPGLDGDCVIDWADDHASDLFSWPPQEVVLRFLPDKRNRRAWWVEAWKYPDEPDWVLCRTCGRRMGPEELGDVLPEEVQCDRCVDYPATRPCSSCGRSLNGVPHHSCTRKSEHFLEGPWA